MRFKATLTNKCLAYLIGISQAVLKVSNDCIIHLTKNSFEIRVRPDAERSSRVFASLQLECFTEFSIESKAANTISFELGLSSLVNALTSVSSSNDIVLKLSKKQGLPCFTVLATTITNITIIQDVPIFSLLTQQELQAYAEPSLPSPEVILNFPDPKHVRIVLERMKAIDKFVTIQAHKRGTLIIKTEAEVVSMRTIWRQLERKLDSTNQFIMETSGASSSTNVKVRASIKELLPMMHFHSTNAKEALICIVPGHAIVLHVMLKNQDDSLGTLTYFLPIASTDINDEDDGVGEVRSNEKMTANNPEQEEENEQQQHSMNQDDY